MPTDAPSTPIPLPLARPTPRAAPSSRPPDWRGRAAIACWLLLFAAVPAAAVQFLAPSPKHRRVHIESFRYGQDPSVLRCNRGDILHLTFSTRDTAHSFFLQEFNVDAKITPGSSDVLVFRPSQPETAPQVAREVTLEARHPGWLGGLVSKSHFRCHVWCGPMHAFEHGKLVIWPNALLAAGWGLLLGIPALAWSRTGREAGLPAANATQTAGIDLFQRLPWLKRLLKRRELQGTLLAVSAVGLYVVILTSLFGTHVAGRNFGVMMVWVVWMFLLTAILTPLAGRSWCLVCPLPLLGDVVQRGTLSGVQLGSTNGYNNHFFGWNLRWPAWLANDWPRLVSFLMFGTFSAALVAAPKFSGWGILALVVLATLLAPIFELRAFCRYLCPVTGFIGLYARNSKLALRVADPQVCSDCTVHTCLKGSAKGWACPFGLCAEDIQENSDCGMCTECIKTCAYDNVTLQWRPFAPEIKVRSAAEAWLSIGMIVMATVYSFVHLGHWPLLRDSVNVLDKGNWGMFAAFVVAVWTLALLLVPAVLLGVAALGRNLAGLADGGFTLMKASACVFIPLGLAVWIAFVTPMLTTNLTFVVQSFSDPFGWGWNLFGAAGSPWVQLWPRAIPFFQVAAILTGFWYALRNGWQLWLSLANSRLQAIRGYAPLALLLLLYTGGMITFYAN
jgi:hypothetical protein